MEINSHQKNHYVISWLILLISVIFHGQNAWPQKVTLGWDLIDNPDIHCYHIYRASRQNSNFTLLDSVLHPTNTYVDENITWNVHYFYVATSVSKFGMESTFSNSVDTLLQGPTSVGILVFSGHKSKSNQVILNWSATTSVYSGFEIQRSKSGTSKSFEVIGFLKAASSHYPQKYQFPDNNLPPGTYNYRLKILEAGGSSQYSDIIEITLVPPLTIHLYQNYPNPFNNQTTITYYLPQDNHVELTIYDVLGHEVCELVDLFQPCGEYTVKWDGQDANGSEVGSGAYYCLLKVSSFIELRKLICIK
jgi:hypothetical protein